MSDCWKLLQLCCWNSAEMEACWNCFEKLKLVLFLRRQGIHYEKLDLALFWSGIVSTEFLSRTEPSNDQYFWGIVALFFSKLESVLYCEGCMGKSGNASSISFAAASWSKKVFTLHVRAQLRTEAIWALQEYLLNRHSDQNASICWRNRRQAKSNSRMVNRTIWQRGTDTTFILQ